MRNHLIPIIALAAIGLAGPASAADMAYIERPAIPVYAQAASIPLQTAVDIANQIGLVSVSSTNRWGDEWQIEGYDVAGGYMEVDVDARTGAVVNVDR
ncbi:MAG: PepSY domain-containing protein [Xanthobacteraceae bacterium]|nr:PepSY domain-containing protein [Xanthobacteraceae bacterium]